MDTNTHPRMEKLHERRGEELNLFLGLCGRKRTTCSSSKRAARNLHGINIEAADPITSIKPTQKSPESQT